MQTFDQFYLRTNPATPERYRKHAKGYQRKIGPLLDAANISSCLDLGCATGLFSHFLRERGYEDVVGVDINAKLIEIARQNVASQFVVDDVLHYVATCGRRFDFVSILDLLEHIPRDKAVGFLTDVRNVLTDGGFALVRTVNLGALTGAAHFHQDFTHVLPLGERSLRQIAIEAGFSRVVFCNQFRMHHLGGKLRAIQNWLLHRLAFRLSGGHPPKVFYRHLYAQLFR
jgi:2-polyprenyl-3-methyl-5-hydroxy-6-metoxy-1,4-benzoquinol methylase